MSFWQIKEKSNDNDKEKKDNANIKQESSWNNGANWKNIRCYRCGKLGYIKKNYHVKIKEENITNKKDCSNATNED